MNPLRPAAGRRRRADRSRTAPAKALLHLGLLVGQQLAAERGGQRVTAEALIGEVADHPDG